MFTAMIAFAAAALSAGEPPRGAAAPKPAATEAAPSEDSAGTAAATPRREIIYCVIETPSGSRLHRKTCQTRKAWLDTGYDPLRPE